MVLAMEIEVTKEPANPQVLKSPDNASAEEMQRLQEKIREIEGMT